LRSQREDANPAGLVLDEDLRLRSIEHSAPDGHSAHDADEGSFVAGDAPGIYGAHDADRRDAGEIEAAGRRRLPRIILGGDAIAHAHPIRLPGDLPDKERLRKARERKGRRLPIIHGDGQTGRTNLSGIIRDLRREENGLSGLRNDGGSSHQDRRWEIGAHAAFGAVGWEDARQ